MLLQVQLAVFEAVQYLVTVVLTDAALQIVALVFLLVSEYLPVTQVQVSTACSGLSLILLTTGLNFSLLRILHPLLNNSFDFP